ncbi:MAG: hypothetical protein R6X02_23165 [Enhygromyxa sp.]
MIEPPSLTLAGAWGCRGTGLAGGDRDWLRGHEVYLAFPNGSGRSKLDASWLDRSLGVTSTWRNWLTVQELATMVG